ALIQVENTYDGVIREKGGVFQSSKRKGDGVGLQSVRHIAEKSGGVSTVTYQDGQFCVKVMLRGVIMLCRSFASCIICRTLPLVGRSNSADRLWSMIGAAMCFLLSLFFKPELFTAQL
ncbi:MAG: GHKL domain-containing protein, partial [Lachnospiraceae bacterium]